MKYEEVFSWLRENHLGFIRRKSWNDRVDGLRFICFNDQQELVGVSSIFPVFTEVLRYNLTLEDFSADDWFYDEKPSWSNIGIPVQEFGPDVVKRNPDSDKYLTAPAYAGRFAGKGRRNKYIYLDMSRIEHLPEHVDEGDLIERGWMKAEPDFQGVAYCRFCGASLKEERYGYLTSTCPKCGNYCGYADFQMCVSC